MPAPTQQLSPPPASAPRGLAARARAVPQLFPAAVWTLFLGTFISRFGAFVMPFLVIYLGKLGYGLERATLAIGAYGAGHLVASLLGGDLADRIGRRKTITLSMFSSAASLLLLESANTYPAILLCVGLVGLTSELYRPASSALLADLVKPGQRVLAFGFYRFAINAGWALGPATAGFLAGRSYFWLFAGNALAATLFGGLAWFALPRGVRGRPKDDPGFRGAVGIIVRDRRFLLLAASGFCTSFIFFQSGASFSVFVTESLGYSEAVYGFLLSLNGILIVLLEIPLTFWTRRLDPIRPMAAGFFLLGAGFGINCLAPGLGLGALVAAMSIHTLGEMIAFPLQGAYAAGLAPVHLRGRYQGMLGMTFALGLIVAPAAGAHVYSWRPSALWLLCTLLGAIAAAAMLATREPGPPARAED